MIIQWLHSLCQIRRQIFEWAYNGFHYKCYCDSCMEPSFSFAFIIFFHQSFKAQICWNVCKLLIVFAPIRLMFDRCANCARNFGWSKYACVLPNQIQYWMSKLCTESYIDIYMWLWEVVGKLIIWPLGYFYKCLNNSWSVCLSGIQSNELASIWLMHIVIKLFGVPLSCPITNSMNIWFSCFLFIIVTPAHIVRLYDRFEALDKEKTGHLR